MSSLWDIVAPQGATARGEFLGREGRVALAQLKSASILGAHLESLRGRSVLLATKDHFHTALALVELDGVARRIVLCTPDLSVEALAHVARAAAAEGLIVDAQFTLGSLGIGNTVVISSTPSPAPVTRRSSEQTEWILLTSGTTGIAQARAALAAAASRARLPRQAAQSDGCGLEHVLRHPPLRRPADLSARACSAAHRWCCPARGEPVADFLARAAAAGVTHISGTPSHWRRALMSGDAARSRPQYVRLSGEVADQAGARQFARDVSRGAASRMPSPRPRPGVAFDVEDGLAGFPAALSQRGARRHRHEGRGRHAAHPLGAQRHPLPRRRAEPLAGADGYVDTGDIVELRGDRYYFRGRRAA